MTVNDSFKRFLVYFAYTILLLLLIYIGARLQNQIRHSLGAKPDITLIKLGFVLRAFLPVVSGVLIALPSFIREVRKPGRRKYDWVRFAAVGIPTLYILVLPLLWYTPLGANLLIHYSFNKILVSATLVQTISGVIFGYTLLDSFKKQNTYKNGVSLSG